MVLPQEPDPEESKKKKRRRKKKGKGAAGLHGWQTWSRGW